MDAQTKNQRIKETYAATKMRRQSQCVHVVTVKVQENKLNREQREALRMAFVEAKWLYNHVLALTKEENGPDVFKLNYTDLTEVTHYDKNGNAVVSKLTYLSSQMRQDILKGICTNISNLAKAKKKGLEVGALKFISSYDSINLKQNGVSHKITGSRKVRVQGIRKALPVNGLEQLEMYPKHEISNARLIQKASGFYIALTVYVSNGEEPRPEKDGGTLGIDMGCQTSFALSATEGNSSSILKKASKPSACRHNCSARPKARTIGGRPTGNCAGRTRKIRTAVMMLQENSVLC